MKTKLEHFADDVDSLVIGEDVRKKIFNDVHMVDDLTANLIEESVNGIIALQRSRLRALRETYKIDK